MIYLIGSLRNPEIPKIAARIRAAGFEVFDDWYAGGPIADDSWRDYEKGRGRTYAEALNGRAAKHVFEFDLKYLTESNAAVLVLPAGKSSHMELGWTLGKGKRGFVLLDTPDRWDVMYQFATGVYHTVDELIVGIEMPYVSKPGEAPEIVSVYNPVYRTLPESDLCFSCGRLKLKNEEHIACRGCA